MESNNNVATVIDFSNRRQGRPVSFLWSIRKGVKQAWRVGSRPAVLQFKKPERKEIEETKTEITEEMKGPWMEMETVNRDLIDEIRAEIEKIVDQLDAAFDETVNDNYDDVIFDADDDDLLKAFERNFSAKRHNDLDFLPEAYDEMEDGPALLAFLEERGVEKETVASWIRQLSEAETADFYVQYNEVHSFQLGEYEYEIEVECYPELKALIDRATETELRLAKAERESFLAYGCPGQRIIWKIDPKAFLARVKAETLKGGAA